MDDLSAVVAAFDTAGHPFGIPVDSRMLPRGGSLSFSSWAFPVYRMRFRVAASKLAVRAVLSLLRNNAESPFTEP